MIGLAKEEASMQLPDLRRTAIALVPLLLASQSAPAATAAGPGALALAALVGAHSPLLARHEKRALTRLLDGHSRVGYPPVGKFSVKADAVVCRASNVDITSRSCKLTFGARSVNLTGRQAHELYATIAEAGVPPDGAAGSVFESLSHLVCTIDPQVIAQKAGGGADCTFDPGAS
jgi:hypothetical protein